MIQKLSDLLRVGLVCAALFAPALASAQDYPARPIELVVPYAPGGASDIIVRTLAPHLEAELGTPIIIVNKAGANTAIGAAHVARAAPDGYTLMLADAALMLNAAVRTRSPGYDLERDFTMVRQVGAAPLVLFVPSAGAKDLASFLEQGRSGGLNIANAGAGSLGHLAAELLQLRTDTTIVSVPYRGSGLALNETVGGQVHATFTSTASGMPLVANGTLRALALAADEPSKDYPDIPTFAQLGVAGVTAVNWWGVIGPAGMEPAVVDTVGSALEKALALPVMTERFAALGITPTVRDPEGFSGMIASELANWRAVVAEAGIEID